MKEYRFDFYNPTNLKSYDLDDSMRYQLSMLDNLDVFTRAHSENVANLTCRICEYLHAKNYFTIYCTICAYLHDIGKQFVPQSILQKNGRLTDEEYEKIKKHTTIGYEMCMKDEKLRPYAAGPLYHHEALNGTGYPKALSGNDIPLVGQIIRVADEFDAITSKRQYKSHVGVCETLNMLIDETETNKNNKTLNALNTMVSESKPDKSKKEKYGKINPKILKALLKVIIDDTEYEIYNLELYINYLMDEIKRLNQIELYLDAFEASKKEDEKECYMYEIKNLLHPGETLDNYKQILSEYKAAYDSKKINLDNLKNEYKNIKKLRV